MPYTHTLHAWQGIVEGIIVRLTRDHERTMMLRLRTPPLAAPAARAPARTAASPAHSQRAPAQQPPKKAGCASVKAASIS
jgi:hypothetical protein